MVEFVVVMVSRFFISVAIISLSSRICVGISRHEGQGQMPMTSTFFTPTQSLWYHRAHDVHCIMSCCLRLPRPTCLQCSVQPSVVGIVAGAGVLLASAFAPVSAPGRPMQAIVGVSDMDNAAVKPGAPGVPPGDPNEAIQFASLHCWAIYSTVGTKFEVLSDRNNNMFVTTG